MQSQTQAQIKNQIELKRKLANSITEEQKELIQKIIDEDIQITKMHYENYKESDIMFQLHMACCYLGGISVMDTLVDNVNDNHNKEFKSIFLKLSNLICGITG